MSRKLTLAAVPAMALALTFLAADQSSSQAFARGGHGGHGGHHGGHHGHHGHHGNHYAHRGHHRSWGRYGWGYGGYGSYDWGYPSYSYWSYPSYGYGSNCVTPVYQSPIDAAPDGSANAVGPNFDGAAAPNGPVGPNPMLARPTPGPVGGGPNPMAQNGRASQGG